jgi:hypothetical protein
MGAGLPLPVLKFKAAELAAKSKGNKPPRRERASWRGEFNINGRNGSEAPSFVIGHMKKMKKKHFIQEN